MDLLADIFDCSWREADCAKCLRRVNGALREAEAAALEVAAKAAEQTAWNCKDAAPATHVLDHAAHSSAHDACHESIEAGARIRALIPAEAA